MSFKKIHKFGGVVMNEMTIPAGYSVGKHLHPYSHSSILISGKVELTVGGEKKPVISGYSVVDIPADTSHVIHAIEDSIWLCIHSESQMNDADQLNLVGD